MATWDRKHTSLQKCNQNVISVLGILVDKTCWTVLLNFSLAASSWSLFISPVFMSLTNVIHDPFDLPKSNIYKSRNTVCTYETRPSLLPYIRLSSALFKRKYFSNHIHPFFFARKFCFTILHGRETFNRWYELLVCVCVCLGYQLISRVGQGDIERCWPRGSETLLTRQLFENRWIWTTNRRPLLCHRWRFGLFAVKRSFRFMSRLFYGFRELLLADRKKALDAF